VAILDTVRLRSWNQRFSGRKYGVHAIAIGAFFLSIRSCGYKSLGVQLVTFGIYDYTNAPDFEATRRPGALSPA